MKKQEQQPQVIYAKNKKRLIDQNRHLHGQIYRLDNVVSTLLAKNMTAKYQQNENDKKFNEKNKEQTQQQIQLVKKLKKKIQLIKNNTKNQEKQDLRKAIDELAYLKVEQEKYQKEKEALIKKRKIKDEGLQLNKFVEESKNQLFLTYKQAIHENNEHRAKIQKIQKEIINLHQIKQLSRTSVAKIVDNPAFQLSKIDNEIHKVKKEITNIEKEWLPRIQSLNTEYFLLKSIKQKKEEYFNQKIKQTNTYKNRILAIKSQTQILSDRQRVSSVIISPEKRNEIQSKIKEEIEKSKWFEEIRIRPEANKKLSQSNGKKVNPQQNIRSQNKSKQLGLQNKGSSYSQKIQNHNEFNNSNLDKLKATTCSGKNEFINLQSKQLRYKQKPKKSFMSVAVGTTFYYDENENKNQQQDLQIDAGHQVLPNQK